MKWLDLLHRWTGGVIGVVLALLGLTGCLLVWKTAWIMVPGKSMPLIRDPASVAMAVQRLPPQPRGGASVVFADNGFALNQLRLPGGRGLCRSGRARRRPLEQPVGAPGAVAVRLSPSPFHRRCRRDGDRRGGPLRAVFVVTGAILWWRTRRTFKWRLLPKRLSRPAIVMHHRDLGIVVAPLLLLSTVTGAAMVFRPFAMIVVAPFGSPAKALAALRPGKVHGGALAADPPWHAMLTTATRHFPDAVPRILSLPRKPGDPITLRMRRADEWLPNGRTTLSFDAATGQLLSSTDAMAMPRAARV